ncbi:MAG TPA: hypothetical protein PLB11_06525, partial [Flavobacterium sp.]|nr:hypothetical protein [Flavobacterium sp.]
MKKLFYLMIFFSSLAYSQYGDAYHKPDTYRLEQMRQDRMNQNDAAHRANVNSSNSGSSASNTNSGTGVSAAQHWEDVKNSNKKVVYTQAELEAAKIAKDLKKKNEEDRINANNRSEVERIQGYLDTADDTSLPSSERLEALDRYMSYFDMKYQRANARADHSSELLKKAYIYFNDENYQKAYENFRIPDNTDQKTKNEINSLKTYCTFLMYEEKSVEEIEDLYKTQKEWSIPLAYVYYLNGNE